MFFISRRFVLILFGSIFLSICLSSCANLGYYFQSVQGQFEILNKSKPIEEVLASPNTEPLLKHKLETVLSIRAFASEQLSLPDNRSYQNYADLQRPFVVWNVIAVPRFSIKPKQWCYLFAGCVTYRGYFSKERASAFADSLRAEDYDVIIGGVAAYSTLGWFDDPVLNTFIYHSEVEIARLIFHELAHQVVYVKDDSVFNESFATTIELEGLRRWLQVNGSEQRHKIFAASLTRTKAMAELVTKYRDLLDKLYASNLNDNEKAEKKKEIFLKLKEEYSERKKEWEPYLSRDLWGNQNLNNAHLAAIATYTDLVPQFDALLSQLQGNLGAFYQKVKELAKLSKENRVLKLKEITALNQQASPKRNEKAPNTPRGD